MREKGARAEECGLVYPALNILWEQSNGIERTKDDG